MKISWWDRNVKIRYKLLVVIDEFLTVSLYQPNEFISRKPSHVVVVVSIKPAVTRGHGSQYQVITRGHGSWYDVITRVTSWSALCALCANIRAACRRRRCRRLRNSVAATVGDDVRRPSWPVVPPGVAWLHADQSARQRRDVCMTNIRRRNHTCAAW